MLGSEAFLKSRLTGLIEIFLILAVVVWFWRVKGATPGKMLLKLRIVDAATGENIQVWQGVVRFLGYYASGLLSCVGFLFMLWDPRKQTLHDKLARSVVIRAR